MYKITSKWPHQDSIHVEWNLGKRCNLDCSYCPSEIHDNISPHTNFDILKLAADKLLEIKKPLRISFTGGEPCVNPDLPKLLDYLKDKVSWINITTNGTMTEQFYFKLPVNHYVFSLHVEDSKNWERCMMNILLFGQQNETAVPNTTPFQINLMAHHSFMDRVRLAADMFDSHFIPYVVRRIRWTKAEDRDYFDDMRYSAEDLNWLLNKSSTANPNCIVDDYEEIHANDIIKTKRNYFKNWKCNAGIESLMINWDGDVHRATCRVGGSLGNIYKGNFEIPVEPIICTREWCTCAADIPLTKVLK